MNGQSGFLDKDKILGSLTEEDIIHIVCDLGSLPPKHDSHGNLIFQSICHNPTNTENSWKLYYYFPNENQKYGQFHCWSKCGDAFNIIELIIRANRVKGRTVTWYKALRYIGMLTHKLATVSEEKKENKNALITDFEWINRLKAVKKKYRDIPVLSEVNENILEMFCYAPHEEWMKEHISRDALSRYEVGYYGLTNQIIIPHRDKENRLIGIRGRYLEQKDIEQIGKYVPLKINGQFLSHQLGSNLYGINITQNKIKSIKKVMLVESEKACMQNYSYFGEDSFALATCGSNITLTQQKLLLQYLKCEEIILAYDREYKDPHSFEAEMYYNKLIKKVANIVPYCKVCLLLDDKNRLPYKASPTDMGKDILLQMLDEKIVITVDEVNRVLKEIDNAKRTEQKLKGGKWKN